MDQLHWMRARIGPPTWPVMMLLLLTTACSSAAGQQAVPEEFVTTQSQAFSLSHPADWEVVNDGDTELRVAAPGEDQVRPSAAVTVDQVYDDGVDGLDTAVIGTLTVLNNIRENVEELDTEAPDISGAQAVRLIESTFTTGGGVDVHHIDLFAVNQDGQLVYARAEAPSAEADPEMLRAVVSSLTLS